MHKMHRVAPVIAAFFVLAFIGFYPSELAGQPTTGNLPATTAPVAVTVKADNGQPYYYDNGQIVLAETAPMQSTQEESVKCGPLETESCEVEVCCSSNDVGFDPQPGCVNKIKFNAICYDITPPFIAEWQTTYLFPGSVNPSNPATWGTPLASVMGFPPAGQWVYFSATYPPGTYWIRFLVAANSPGCQGDCWQQLIVPGSPASFTPLCNNGNATYATTSNPCVYNINYTTPGFDYNCTGAVTINAQLKLGNVVILTHNNLVPTQLGTFAGQPGGSYSIVFTFTLPTGETFTCSYAVNPPAIPPSVVVPCNAAEVSFSNPTNCLIPTNFTFPLQSELYFYCFPVPPPAVTNWKVTATGGGQSITKTSANGGTVFLGNLLPSTTYTYTVTVTVGGTNYSSLSCTFTTPSVPSTSLVCSPSLVEWHLTMPSTCEKTSTVNRPQVQGCNGNPISWNASWWNNGDSLYGFMNNAPWTLQSLTGAIGSMEGQLDVHIYAYWPDGSYAECWISIWVESVTEISVTCDGYAGPKPNLQPCQPPYIQFYYPDVDIVCPQGETTVTAWVRNMFGQNIWETPIPIGAGPINSIPLVEGWYSYGFTVSNNGVTVGCTAGTIDVPEPCDPCDALNTTVPTITLIGSTATITSALWGVSGLPIGWTANPTATSLTADCGDLGLHTIYIVVDGTSCSRLVKIVDATPPVVSWSPGLDLCVPYVLPIATAIDNCDSNPAITYTVNGQPWNGFAIQEAGTYTVVVTATDDSGNSSTTTKTVVLEDCEPCDLQTATSITASYDYCDTVCVCLSYYSDCEDGWEWIMGQIGGQTVFMVNNPDPTGCLSFEVTPGTWELIVSATDVNGNISYDTVLVTVNCPEEPLFICGNIKDYTCDGPTGPQPDAPVFVSGPNFYAETMTDASGNYSVQVPQPGTYTVLVQGGPPVNNGLSTFDRWLANCICPSCVCPIFWLGADALPDWRMIEQPWKHMDDSITNRVILGLETLPNNGHHYARLGYPQAWQLGEIGGDVATVVVTDQSVCNVDFMHVDGNDLERLIPSYELPIAPPEEEMLRQINMSMPAKVAKNALAGVLVSYPNPSTGMVSMSWNSNDLQPTKVIFCDLIGTQVSEVLFHQGITISLQPGSYLAIAVDNNGNHLGDPIKVVVLK